MKPVLKGLSSPALSPGPPKIPENPLDFWVNLWAHIGFKGNNAADDFVFYVCSPSRLATVVQVEGPQFGRHLLIVERFDWDEIEAEIQSLLEGIEGDDWESVAQQIGRYGYWEFEDYQEL